MSSSMLKKRIIILSKNKNLLNRCRESNVKWRRNMAVENRAPKEVVFKRNKLLVTKCRIERIQN